MQNATTSPDPNNAMLSDIQTPEYIHNHEVEESHSDDDSFFDAKDIPKDTLEISSSNKEVYSDSSSDSSLNDFKSENSNRDHPMDRGVGSDLHSLEIDHSNEEPEQTNTFQASAFKTLNTNTHVLEICDETNKKKMLKVNNEDLKVVDSVQCIPEELEINKINPAVNSRTEFHLGDIPEAVHVISERRSKGFDRLFHENKADAHIKLNGSTFPIESPPTWNVNVTDETLKVSEEPNGEQVSVSDELRSISSQGRSSLSNADGGVDVYSVNPADLASKKESNTSLTDKKVDSDPSLESSTDKVEIVDDSTSGSIGEAGCIDEVSLLRAKVEDLSEKLIRSQGQMEALLEEKQRWLINRQQQHHSKHKSSVSSDTAAIVVKFAQVINLALGTLIFFPHIDFEKKMRLDLVSSSIKTRSKWPSNSQ